MANTKFEHQNNKCPHSVDPDTNGSNTWLLEMMHPDLFATNNLVYDPSNFKCSKPQIAIESVEYGASSFTINNYFIEFRVAKSTPIKVGQFVTLWKRINNGSIQPYDILDRIDFFIVVTPSI